MLIFPGERDRALELFAQLGAEVLAEERTPFGQSIVVQTRAGSLITLAGHPAIQSLAGHHERRPANDLTRQRLRISTNTVTAAPAGNFRGLTGAGVLVNVNDTGAYADHPDLTPARITGLTTDLNGHGTHVVGTILGNGSKSATVTKASGSTNGANFRGMAPSAKAFVQSIAPGAFTDELLQRGAALTNALISNNSWSYGVNEYDIHAASYDAAVRDALPGVTGAQPLLLVFPAGNGGGGNGSGLGGIPGGIESPGTAKNVISVGGQSCRATSPTWSSMPKATPTLRFWAIPTAIIKSSFSPRAATWASAKRGLRAVQAGRGRARLHARFLCQRQHHLPDQLHRFGGQ